MAYHTHTPAQRKKIKAKIKKKAKKTTKVKKK